MPPAFIRRPVTVTRVAGRLGRVVVASPLLLAPRVLASALTGRRQPLVVARADARLLRATSSPRCVACGALWLAAGAGRLIGRPRSQRLHWRLVRLVLRRAGRGRARRARDRRAPGALARGRSRARVRPAADRLQPARRAGRHDLHRRRARCRATIDGRASYSRRASRIDPSVDLLAHRLPQAMLDTSDREECEARIEELTAELGPRGALLLFPEGGNFTPSAGALPCAVCGARAGAGRLRALSRCPRPAAPAGRCARRAAGPRAGRRGVRRAHRARACRLPAASSGAKCRSGGRCTRGCGWSREDVPATDEDRVDWLYDWWKRIDDWIDGQHDEERASGLPVGQDG